MVEPDPSAHTTTLLKYEISLQPKLSIPSAIVTCVVKAGLPANMTAMAKRAEQVTFLPIVHTCFWSPRGDATFGCWSGLCAFKLLVHRASVLDTTSVSCQTSGRSSHCVSISAAFEQASWLCVTSLSDGVLMACKYVRCEQACEHSGM